MRKSIKFIIILVITVFCIKMFFRLMLSNPYQYDKIVSSRKTDLSCESYFSNLETTTANFSPDKLESYLKNTIDGTSINWNLVLVNSGHFTNKLEKIMNTLLLLPENQYELKFKCGSYTIRSYFSEKLAKDKKLNLLDYNTKYDVKGVIMIGPVIGGNVFLKANGLNNIQFDEY